MNSSTEATLEDLCCVEWFRNVGVDDVEGVVDVLTSWEGAIESCSSKAWENRHIDAANQI